MSFTGYHIFRGLGGLADIDWTTPVGIVTGAGTSKDLVGLGHVANAAYTYAIRAVRADMELPDISAVVEVKMDGSADWEGNKPDPPLFIEAEQSSSGDIVLRWDYVAGATAASDFGIYYQQSPVFVVGSPDETEAYTADTLYTKTITGLVGDATYWFAITARSTGAVESQIKRTGPIVALSTAPDAPTIEAEPVFKT